MVDIVAGLEALEEDAGLLDEAAFAARADALEDLDGGVLGGLDALEGQPALGASLAALRRRARALRRRLERVDATLFARLREAIRDGALRGEGLRRELLRLAPPPEGKDDQGGYDALDALIAGVLLDEPPPPTVRPELCGWDPEMVPYQPTPARIVLELAGHVRRGDVFYDLGAGLGQVCVLVHLLAGARAVGVEVDPALWAHAQRLARGLRLAGVTFAVGDARQADLSPGTFFFLYTPFTGALLDAVLARLRGVAASHRIRVASYGPCTPTVARQAWLVPEGPAHEDPEQLAVFQRASGGAPGSRRSATPDRARPKRPTHRRALYPRYSFSLAVSASVSLTQST